MSPRKFIDYWRDAVWADLELTTAEKLVLLAYGMHADFDTGANVRPGQTKIGRLCRLSRRHVMRITTSVVEKRWMVCITKGGWPKKGETRVTSSYQLTFPTSDMSSRFREATSDICAATGDISSTDWRHGVTGPSKQPSMKPSSLNGDKKSPIDDCETCAGSGQGFSGGFCPACKQVAVA